MSKCYVHPDDLWDAIVDADVVGTDEKFEQFIRKNKDEQLHGFAYSMCVAIACTVNAKHPECKGLWD